VQLLFDLINLPFDLVVQNEENQQLLHFRRGHIQFLRKNKKKKKKKKKGINCLKLRERGGCKKECASHLSKERDGDFGVGFDNFQQHLRPDFPEHVGDELGDEGIIHDDLLVGVQDLLESIDLVVLVSTQQLSHGLDFGMVL